MNNNRKFTLNTNQNIIVEFTDERIIPASGLAVVGALLGKSDFAKKLNRMDVTKNRSQHQIKNGDIILTYIGMLCMGKPYFEAVHEMDEDKAFYQAALGITRSIPSEETLRQRMDDIGDKQKYYEYEILSVDEPDPVDESVNREHVDHEFGMESGSLFTEMRKDKTGFYAVKYEEGMEDGWSLFSGDSRPSLIFKTKEEAMKYVRSGKCNYVEYAVPTFWDKEISEEEHQKERKYCDGYDRDWTVRHNNKWYECEFITTPWDTYIFNNHGNIELMSKKLLLRIMDKYNVNIEIRE